MATDVRLESREERHTRGGLEIVRTVRVTPYTDAPAIVATLLGEIKLSGGGYQRVLPHRDPLYPFCRCQEANISSVDSLDVAGIPTTTAALNVAEYSGSARIVATYRPFENEDASDEADELEIATETFDFKNLVQQAPHQWWGFEDDAVKLPQEGLQFARTIGYIDYTLTRNYCLTIPTLAMSRLQNRVNRYPFSFSRLMGFGKKKALRQWGAECVRYDGSNVQRRITNKGIPFYTLAHRFGINTTWDIMGDFDTAVEIIQSADGDRGVNKKVNFVGWNRIFRYKFGWWQKPKLYAPANVAQPANETIFLYDTEITQEIKGETVAGFRLLFNRYAD